MTTKLYKKSDETYYVSSESINVFPCAYRGYIAEDSTGAKQIKQIDVKSRLTLEETLTELSKTSSTRDYIESYSCTNADKTVTFKVIARIDGFRLALNIELDSSDTTQSQIVDGLKKNFALKLTTYNAPLSTAAEETTTTKRIQSYELNTAVASSESIQTNDYLDCAFTNDADTYYFTGLKITTAPNLINEIADSEHTLIVIQNGSEYLPSKKRIDAENVAAVNDMYSLASTVVNGEEEFSLKQLTANDTQNSDDGNTASYKGSIAFGYGNKTTKDYQILLGTYAETSRQADFAIGDGTSESKSNSIEVGPYTYTNSAAEEERKDIKSLYLHNDGIVSIDNNTAFRVTTSDTTKPSAFDLYSTELTSGTGHGVKTIYSNTIDNLANSFTIDPNINESSQGITPKLTLSNSLAYSASDSAITSGSETTKYEHCLYLPQISKTDTTHTRSTHLYSDNTTNKEKVLVQTDSATPTWCTTAYSTETANAYLKTTPFSSLHNLTLSNATTSKGTDSESTLVILSKRSISANASTTADNQGAFIIRDAANYASATSCIAMGAGQIKVSDSILVPTLSSDAASSKTSYQSAALKFYNGSTQIAGIWADNDHNVYIGRTTPLVFNFDPTLSVTNLYTTSTVSLLGNIDHKFSAGFFSQVTISDTAKAATTDTTSGTLNITGGIRQSGTYSNYFTGALTVGKSITTTSSVIALNYLATSDKRLKHDIEDYHCEKSILDLPVKKFKFNSDNSEHIGCLAQDLQEICPEIVKENDEGYLSIAENKIVYLLLDEVKKLKAEVDELKNK